MAKTRLQDQLDSNKTKQQIEDGNVKVKLGAKKSIFMQVNKVEPTTKEVDGKTQDTFALVGVDLNDETQSEIKVTVDRNNSIDNIVNGIPSTKYPGTMAVNPITPGSDEAFVTVQDVQFDSNGVGKAWRVEPISETASLSTSPVTLSLNSRKQQASVTTYKANQAKQVPTNNPEALMNAIKSVMDVPNNLPLNARGGALVRFIPSDGDKKDQASYLFQHLYEQVILQDSEGDQQQANLPTRNFDRYAEVIIENRNHPQQSIAAHASEQFANLQTFMRFASDPNAEGFFEVIPTAQYRTSALLNKQLFDHNFQQTDTGIVSDVTTKLTGKGKNLLSRFNIYKDVTNPDDARRRQQCVVNAHITLESFKRDDMVYVTSINPTYTFTKGFVPSEIPTANYKAGNFISVSLRNYHDTQYLESNGQHKQPRHDVAIAIRNGEDVSKLIRPQKESKPAETPEQKTVDKSAVLPDAKSAVPTKETETSAKASQASTTKSAQPEPVQPEPTKAATTSPAPAEVEPVDSKPQESEQINSAPVSDQPEPDWVTAPANEAPQEQPLVNENNSFDEIEDEFDFDEMAEMLQGSNLFDDDPIDQLDAGQEFEEDLSQSFNAPSNY